MANKCRKHHSHATFYIMGKMQQQTTDKIEQFRGHQIQHGKLSDRVYLMKMSSGSDTDLPNELVHFAQVHQYTKIFAKVPANQTQLFLQSDYQIEASIPNFFGQDQDVHFLSYYLSADRKQSKSDMFNQQVKSDCDSVSTDEPESLNSSLSLRLCSPDDIHQMAKLYGQVFPTYPFPIHDPDYIRETMLSHVVYFGIWQKHQLLALASSEIDFTSHTVEMTDFATHPDARGQRLAQHLLLAMQNEMKRRNINLAYTIARAASYGINLTFARCGYTFAGRLINNTQIAGKIEDMNVWYMSLEQLA